MWQSVSSAGVGCLTAHRNGTEAVPTPPQPLSLRPSPALRHLMDYDSFVPHPNPQATRHQTGFPHVSSTNQPILLPSARSCAQGWAGKGWKYANGTSGGRVRRSGRCRVQLSTLLFGNKSASFRTFDGRHGEQRHISSHAAHEDVRVFWRRVSSFQKRAVSGADGALRL